MPKLRALKIPPGANIPDDPNIYAMIVQGDCLEPVVRDGDSVIVSPGSTVEGGQIVHIKLKNGAQGLKRLTNALPPVIGRALPTGSEVAYMIGCEMLNPPKQFFLEASDVESVRAVVGLIRKGKFVAVGGNK
jgi:hypothetical protein